MTTPSHWCAPCGRRLFQIRLAALLFLGLVPSGPAAAQVDGRWSVTFESGSVGRADLRLSRSGTAIEGSILLDTRDAAWEEVSGTTGAGGDTFDLRAGGGQPIGLTGRVTSSGLEGVASLGGGAEFRWHAARLAATDEFYPSPPGFVLHQILIGDGSSSFRIPGSWLGAAAAAGETTAAMLTRYRALAAGAGLAPLEDDSLSGEALPRAMGLRDRSAFRQEARRALAAIRAGLRNDTARARFDYLFRPAGDWLIDLHDVALARAHRPFPAVSWAAATPALRAVRLIPDTATAPEAVMLGLYRLFVLSASDSDLFADVKDRMKAGEPVSAAAALALIEGYREATGWYEEVMRFFLLQPWMDGPAGPQSLVDMVRGFWGDSLLVVPEVRAYLYGYPEGASRAAVDSAVLAGVVSPRNTSATDWLARHGETGLLQVLARLDGGFGGNTSLNAGGERIVLSSLGEYRRTAFNGFLEPRDMVLIDPSYEPLLALGTLVHEWQHIIHEHRRGRLAFQNDGTQLTYRFLDPFLAEGLAEWASEAILAPVSRRYPLVALGEAEKRASLSPDNPHVLGYLLLRTLGQAITRPGEVLTLLAEEGTDPGAVARQPALRRRWARYTGPDRVVPRRGAPVLLPETGFVVEGMVPEVVGRRIMVGP